jgi:hypothetical protein
MHLLTSLEVSRAQRDFLNLLNLTTALESKTSCSSITAKLKKKSMAK